MGYIYVCSSGNVIENGTFPSFLNCISYLSPISTLFGNCELSVDSCVHDNVQKSTHATTSNSPRSRTPSRYRPYSVVNLVSPSTLWFYIQILSPVDSKKAYPRLPLTILGLVYMQWIALIFLSFLPHTI